MIKIFTFSLLLLLITPISHSQPSTLDQVDIYIVPMDDFPESAASAIAKFMTQDMHIWAKSSLRLGTMDIATLPGTNQLISQDIIEKSQPSLRRLPSTSNATYFLLLTTRDINDSSGNFRFQFSTHNPNLNTSVISLARMSDDYDVDNKPIIDNVSLLRFYKMTKRAIGEHHFKWTRSSDPLDLMYAPLMGTEDLDRISINHTEPNILKNEKKTKPINQIKPTSLEI